MRPRIFPHLPYIVHTNRELGLMLKGTKPLSVFGWVEGDVVMRYLRMFDRHVACGRFVKRAACLNYHPCPLETVFFALPDHEWRIDAYIELWNEPGAWTAARERRQGELLGYEDWQNDFWLNQDWRPPPLN